jgi:uncharacterized protein YkwD
MTLRHCLAFVVIALFAPVPPSLAAEPAAEVQEEPEKPAVKLHPRDQRDVNRIVAHFRRAKKDPEKQLAAVGEAMQFGEPAVLAVLQIIALDLQPQLVRYRGRFHQQASALAKRQVQQVDLEEVARLRAAVLALKQDPNLTKEKIVQVADPAMKRLEQVFVIQPAAVLAQSRDLPAERERLKIGGVLWERCVAYLYAATPEGPEKPKSPPTFEQYLQGEEELAVGLAVPMDPATQEILAANAKLASQLDPEESRAILALNLTRNLLGLRPCAIDLKLCAAARDHSKDMATLKFFAHESPVPGKKTPWDRAKNFGASASGENIFMGLQDGRAANLGWFHSPGHHKNMLGDHKRVGMGRHGVYFTELLGG